MFIFYFLFKSSVLTMTVLFDRKYSIKLVILWNIFTLKIIISDLIY